MPAVEAQSARTHLPHFSPQTSAKLFWEWKECQTALFPADRGPQTKLGWWTPALVNLSINLAVEDVFKAD